MENHRRPRLPAASHEGFQRIRYYGFLANRYREQRLAHAARPLCVLDVRLCGVLSSTESTKGTSLTCAF